MGQISRAAKEQAITIIKAYIQDRKDEIIKNNAELLEGVQKKARETADKKFSYSKRTALINKLREDATTKERELREALGCNSGRWRNSGIWHDVERTFDERVEEIGKDLLATTKIGEMLEELDNRYREIDKKVFVATTHPQLVQLINDMTDN